MRKYAKSSTMLLAVAGVLMATAVPAAAGTVTPLSGGGCNTLSGEGSHSAWNIGSCISQAVNQYLKPDFYINAKGAYSSSCSLTEYLYESSGPHVGSRYVAGVSCTATGHQGPWNMTHDAGATYQGEVCLNDPGLGWGECFFSPNLYT